MIEVIQSGPATSLQDSGRPGLRHMGIPEGGAADRLSFALANYIVGNSWNAPALECALGGLQIRFTAPATIALSGAKMFPRLGDKPITYLQAYAVKPDDILSLGYADTGCRAYLAIAGGLAGETFFASVATYTLAKIGGLEGRFLKPGDRLERAGLTQAPPATLPFGYSPELSRHTILRTRPGPEFESLSAHSRRALFTHSFTATAQTDRMGSRLQGPHIGLEAPFSMASSPLLPGTLQVPPDGNPILALVDGHCIGGYPRAVQIIRADLWQLGQIAPHSKVSFQRCFDDEFENILINRTAFYSTLMHGFTF